MEKRPGSYEEFWPYYVTQHLHPVNRALRGDLRMYRRMWMGRMEAEGVVRRPGAS
jgi:hypothetical protein